MTDDKERAIRAIIDGCVGGYAAAFSDRHLNEVDDPEGTINSSLCSLKLTAKWRTHKLLSIMMGCIAKLNYKVIEPAESFALSSLISQLDCASTERYGNVLFIKEDLADNYYLFIFFDTNKLGCPSTVDKIKTACEQLCINFNVQGFGTHKVKIISASPYDILNSICHLPSVSTQRLSFNEGMGCEEFWDFICKSDHGYTVVSEELKKQFGLLTRNILSAS